MLIIVSITHFYFLINIVEYGNFSHHKLLKNDDINNYLEFTFEYFDMVHSLFISDKIRMLNLCISWILNFDRMCSLLDTKFTQLNLFFKLVVSN